MKPHVLKKVLYLLSITGFILVTTPSIAQLTDAEIEALIAAQFQKDLESTWPNPDVQPNCSNPEPTITKNCTGMANYAKASYYLDQGTSLADEYILSIPTFTSNGYTTGCYFPMRGFLAIFLDERLNRNMSTAAYQHLAELFYEVLNGLDFDGRYLWSRIEFANKGMNYRGSENHNSLERSIYYLVAQELAKMDDYKDRILKSDNYTVAEHHEAWAGYWKRYFKERSFLGLEIESNASGGYLTGTLADYYNLYEYTDDLTLRRQVKNYLDLFHADKAQHFMNEVVYIGGVRNREFKTDRAYYHDRGYSEHYPTLYGWSSYGLNSSTVSMISDYRPPQVVEEIALNKMSGFLVDNGSFGIFDGRESDYNTKTANQDTRYKLDAYGRGGVKRFHYVSDSYVMGSAIYAPGQEMVRGTGQNRSMGVFFDDNIMAKRYRGPAYPDCTTVPDSSENNSTSSRIIVHGAGNAAGGREDGFYEIMGITGTNAQVIWRDNLASESVGTRALVSKPLYYLGETVGEWWFSQTDDAYVALRVAHSGYTVNEHAAVAHSSRNIEQHGLIVGKMFLLNDMWAPIIIEAAEKSDYTSYEAFKTAISDNELTVVSQNEIIYTSEEGQVFHVFPQTNTVPKLDGNNMDFTTEFTYSSPYVHGMTPTDPTVTLTSPLGGETILDFSFNEFSFESECLSYNPNFWSLKTAADASGGYYLVQQNKSGTWQDGNQSLTLNVDVEEDGTYILFAKTKAPDASMNSFKLRVDDGEIRDWEVQSTGGGFIENKFIVTGSGVPIPIDLTAGAHTIEIIPGDEGTGLDQIILTENMDVANFQFLGSSPCIPDNTTWVAIDEVIEIECLPFDDDSWNLVNNTGASGNYHLSCTNKTNGSFLLGFEIAEAGNYRLYGKFIVPNESSNSIKVSIDGGAPSTWPINVPADVTAFTWQTYKPNTPVDIYFTPGIHTIEVLPRELGTGIDQLVLSADLNLSEPEVLEVSPCLQLPEIAIESECQAYDANTWSLAANLDASGGYYLINTKKNENSIVFNFAVETTGNYALFGRFLVTDANSNSVKVIIDGGVEETWSIPVPSDPSMFKWQAFTVSGDWNNPIFRDFTAGLHTIEILPRETGTGIDHLVLTNNRSLSEPEPAADSPCGIGGSGARTASSETVLGVENLEKLVYPNPSFDRITIQGVERGDKYTIVNLSGKVMLQGEMGADAQVDIRSLSAGIYYLRMDNWSASILKK